MADPAEFPLFHSLPAEIRRLIWRHALPGARIHRISTRRAHGRASSSCAPPTLLFVSREAHDEALRVLKPLRLPAAHAGACAVGAASTGSLCCVAVLVDPAIDTVLLPGRPRFALAYGPWLARSDVAFGLVRSLAVDVGWGVPRRAGFVGDVGVEEMVRWLGGVERLHLVTEYSLFNQGVECDSSSWTPVPKGGQPGWNWVPMVNGAAWENAGCARNWQGKMVRKLEAEKMRCDAEGESRWVPPEVVLSLIKYERVPESFGYWDEDEILGRFEPMKTDEPKPKRSFWSELTKLFTERLGL